MKGKGNKSVKNKISTFLYTWLPRIFGCHTKPDRSFFYHGRQFPICARCTGELCGILLTFISFWLWHPDIMISFILMIPMLIDGFVQRLTSYESNNIKRFITGLLFGIGLTVIFLISVVYTFKQWYNYGMQVAIKTKN